jgi:hypothetical protein
MSWCTADLALPPARCTHDLRGQERRAAGGMTLKLLAAESHGASGTWAVKPAKRH